MVGELTGGHSPSNILTVIDTVTNLVEIVRIDGKDSDHITRKFAQCWLTRYPWPQRCIHDPGGEFTGPEFQILLQNCHIRDVCTTAKNPQSNAVCERMYQTVGNVLRPLLHGEPPQNIASAKEYICWLPYQEIYVTGTAPCSTGTGYHTSMVRLPSWYCPTFFFRSIVFHFYVTLRYIRLLFPVLLTRCFSLFR